MISLMLKHLDPESLGTCPPAHGQVFYDFVDTQVLGPGTPCVILSLLKNLSTPPRSRGGGRRPEGSSLPSHAGIYLIFGMAQHFPATHAGIHSIFGMTLYSSPLKRGGVEKKTHLLEWGDLTDRQMNGEIPRTVG